MIGGEDRLIYLVVNQFGQRVQVVNVVERSGQDRAHFERAYSGGFAVLCEPGKSKKRVRLDERATSSMV